MLEVAYTVFMWETIEREFQTNSLKLLIKTIKLKSFGPNNKCYCMHYIFQGSSAKWEFRVVKDSIRLSEHGSKHNM